MKRTDWMLYLDLKSCTDGHRERGVQPFLSTAFKFYDVDVLLIHAHQSTHTDIVAITGTCVRGPKPLAKKEQKLKNPPRMHCSNYIRWYRSHQEQRYERLKIAARK